MNRDPDSPPRNQPDERGDGTRAGGGGGGGGDDDDHRRHGRRRRYPYYKQQDDTQLYGTPGGGPGARTGTRTQRNRLQDECDRGYEDGLRAGEKDARRGQSSDPQRWNLYRTGGETVNRPNRPVDAKQAYRDCFLRGYTEAYSSFKLNPGGASPPN